MKPLVLLLLQLAFCGFSCAAGKAAAPPPPNTPNFACNVAANPALANFGFCNGALDLPARAADLVKRLNLQEKIGFLWHTTVPVPRLGIPSYNWWSEGLHGLAFGTSFTSLVPGATSFPQVILTAASFNYSLYRAIGETVSTEARAMHNVGLAGLTFWSPNINMVRDPRWGRAQETPGEDPLVTSKYADGFVSGMQHSDAGPQKLKAAACCKHYTAYDLDNWGGTSRFIFDANVTKQDMEDTFQVPFKSCVNSGVACAMCSYNRVNGKPTCADPDLLGGTIRGEWGLNGYIVSDCDAAALVYGIRYAPTPEDAAAMTISAGLDLDCGSFLYNNTGKAIEMGKLKEAQIDKAITNGFLVLLRLGFFDGDPRKIAPFGGLGPSDVCSPAHQELARDAARQGIVLLKNANSVLPLNPKNIKSMAVIGPNANATNTMIGNYEGIPCRYTSPLEGLSDSVKTVYQAGCENVFCNGSSIVDPAKAAAAEADVTVLIVGTDLSVEAEGLDRETLGWPGQQGNLINEVVAAANGPVILVIMSGGPIDVTAENGNNRIPSILWAGYPGEAGGAAIADVIFGRYNPSGRTPYTWYEQSYLNQVPMTDMRMRPDPATGYPGRTYRFYTGKPLYPFGYGLSYTEYKYQNVVAPANLSVQLPANSPCHSGTCDSVLVADLGASGCSKLLFDVRVQVKNSGAVDGSHSVLLYLRPPQVHGAPQKQLVAFDKVFVAAGGVAEVVFKMEACRDLSVADEEGQRRLLFGPHVLSAGDVEHTLTLEK